MFMPDADVNEDGSPKSPENTVVEGQGTVVTDPAPGSQTDPALLLIALKDERTKRKNLEDRIVLLENAGLSDTDKIELGKLKTQIEESNSKLETLTQDNVKKDLLIAHPVLGEKWAEFETFRADPDNQGMGIKTAAKAFLVENGLLDAPRRGLEKPTGGPRVPVSTKMTHEEIKHLRETDFKKYQDMLMAGLINP